MLDRELGRQNNMIASKKTRALTAITSIHVHRRSCLSRVYVNVAFITNPGAVR